MRRIIALSLFLATAACQEQPAFAGKACLTYKHAQEISETLAQEYPHVRSWTLEGEQAKKLAAYINAQPPVTHWDIDAYVFNEDTDTQMVMVSFVHAGCVFHSEVHTSKLINDTLDAVFGRGA